VLQSVPAAGECGHPEVCDYPLNGSDHCRDRGIPDDVETGRHLGLRTRPHMRFDDVGVQVAGADAVRRIGVRLMQPGGA
jgi:hypothetical protein